MKNLYLSVCCVVLIVLFHLASSGMASSGMGSVHAADWSTITVPDAWRSVPTGDQAPINGYSWYRVLVRVPAEWDGQNLTLLQDRQAGVPLKEFCPKSR